VITSVLGTFTSEQFVLFYVTANPYSSPKGKILLGEKLSTVKLIFTESSFFKEKLNSEVWYLLFHLIKNNHHIRVPSKQTW